MQPIYSLISYIFDPLPPTAFYYYIFLALLVAAILCCSFYLRLRIRKNKDDKTFRRLFRGFPAKLETVAVVIGINLLSRYYNVAFLSMRLILFVTLAIGAYLVYRMAIAHMKEYPSEKKRHHEQMEKNKYIPRKKNK
jgi:phosphatidylserine synthase